MMLMVDLTYFANQLVAAVDSGRYERVTVDEALSHIAEKTVIPWLRAIAPTIDTSIMTGEFAKFYHDEIERIHGGYAGDERRKWGIERQGMCLLLAWTITVIQKQVLNSKARPSA